MTLEQNAYLSTSMQETTTMQLQNLSVYNGSINSTDNPVLLPPVPEMHSTAYQVVGVFLFSLIFIVGFIGNILVIVVVCRCKAMRTLTNFYLVSLAVSDCLVLVSATLPAIPEFFYYQHVWLYGSFMCSIFVFMQYLGINASALSITAFTIERYIGICHPMKAQIICTVRRAKIIICGLWIFDFGYNAIWLYLAKTETKTFEGDIELTSCQFSRVNREQYRSIFMVDLTLFYIVPLILTCVLYALIALALRKSTDDMKKPLKPALNKPTIEKLIPNRPVNKRTVTRQTMMGDRKELLKKMEKARRQVVKMLTVIAVLFAVLWLPYRAWVVYNSFASYDLRFHNKWFYLCARCMIFLNSAINPILYSAMSKKFRHAFLAYTPCCLKKYAEYQAVGTSAPTTRAVSQKANHTVTITASPTNQTEVIASV